MEGETCLVQDTADGSYSIERSALRLAEESMTSRQVHAVPCLFLLLGALSIQAAAQIAPWTTSLRGSWVQTGPAAQGDLTLAGRDGTAEIVVAGNETAAVRQAAAFLACDIEKISGKTPPVVDRPERRSSQYPARNPGNAEMPAAIDAAAMRGQWESYRIVTAGRVVWLVGSNPRGTAFAAYTLSERLGIDPLYIWTGYLPAASRPARTQAHQLCTSSASLSLSRLFP